MIDTQANRLNKLRLYATQSGGRLFRNNVGEGWVGKEKWFVHAGKRILSLVDPRRLIYGLTKGSSDLIGWKSMEITPDMVGSKVAVFWAMEEKFERDTLKPEQASFLNAVKSAGGIAEIAHTKKGETEIKSI